MRCAEINGKCPTHFLVDINRHLELLARECSAGGDDGEAVRPRILIRLRMCHDLLLREESVGIDARLMAGCLRAVFAVLSAAPAASVDDRTQIDMIPAELLLQTICLLAQLFERRVHKDGTIICGTETIACNDLVGKFCHTTFSHKKIPASQ